jgi:hypothetical protein
VAPRLASIAVIAAATTAGCGGGEMSYDTNGLMRCLETAGTWGGYANSEEVREYAFPGGRIEPTTAQLFFNFAEPDRGGARARVDWVWSRPPTRTQSAILDRCLDRSRV